ncbi:hypothetical protein HOP50_17g79270 [Chloropicon primus]|uniref:Uncharacterized protein n=1 Tax=Chloropicon primus TaxID=1764295 RepID=A0A5B8MXV3_9CHLO|nr:hypothetical protein A3770_17p79050 [Chloropicon primus]UPR04585.1 hypothetical protein HOP50_17g79270 [Chloropicon primus]|eukprot:QDZ25387.1 hypothetical protein A3770_17p79050 [Chloropicon primus]
MAPMTETSLKEGVVEDQGPPMAMVEAGTMQLESEPRILEYLNISDYSLQTRSAVPIARPLFQPFPPTITFEGYEPLESYTAVLSLRNIDTVARRVKVLPLQTSFFSIKRIQNSKKKDSTSKVAAGMEVKYQITFKPETKDDYTSDIVVVTEREKFLVQIRAIGAQAELDFPSYFNFDMCPVGCTTQKTFLIHNVGEKIAAFSIETQSPFSVTPKEATLDCGESMQCSVAFVPDDTTLYSIPIVITFFDGRVCEALFEGGGCELDVSLLNEQVYLMPTFISRSSQKRFKIVNNSKIPVEFDFHQYMDSNRDEDERNRAMVELDSEESEALSGLETNMMQEDGKVVELQQAIYEMHRTFNVRRRTIENEKYKFYDNQYQIEPISGTLLPKSELEVTIKFYPQGPLEHQRIAYLQIQGRAKRLPLYISGQGIGPKAVFSYDVLDVGDTYVNTLHQYEVEIHNRGQIEAEFCLEPPTTEFGKRFSFEPNNGLLSVNEVRTIKVFLQSDILGEFAESFVWKVMGASENLMLDFRGRVVGPTFDVSSHNIDYGLVAYGFKYIKEFTIHNTSEISMEYMIHITGAEEDKDFVVYPSEGRLLPSCEEKVTVELNSHAIKKYDATIVIEAKNASDRVKNIQVSAECIVPELKLNTEVLDFGDCFLGYPYEATLQVVNDSDLPAKFKVIEQDDQSKGLAEYTSVQPTDDIGAHDTVDVKFTLKTTRLGRINLPVLIDIVGSGDKPPLEVVLASRSMGPVLEFSSGPDAKEVVKSIEFGKIPVLQDFQYHLYMHNPSLIPAEFKTFIASKDSAFSVDIREGSLQPQESCMLTVTVHVDETMKFLDELHVLILEGDDVCIPLSASGTGTTIRCEELESNMVADIDAVNTKLEFGSQLTNSKFTMEVVLQNMGRRSQNIQWRQNLELLSAVPSMQDKGKQTAAAGFKSNNASMNSAMLALAAINSMKSGIDAMAEEREPMFTVTPDRIKIPPKTACTFTVSGMSPQPGLVEEYLTCEVLAGKTVKPLFDVLVSADVAHPLLEFSADDFYFCYSFSEEEVEPPKSLVETLKVKNISKLAVTFNMKTALPFVVTQPDWTLQPNEEMSVDIMFDMSKVASVQTSEEFSNQILVSYPDNPHKDVLHLRAEVNYPNLSFNVGRVDFGCILNDTLAREHVEVTNMSKVDANFNWWLRLNDQGSKGMSDQSFDILPTSGVVPAGEKCNIEFTFFAQQGTRASATAVCEVMGGPTYEIPITADSSVIKYTVEPKVIDLGPQLYDKVFETDLLLQNTGRVPFEYHIDLDTLSRYGIVEAYPMSGYLQHAQKQVLQLKISAGIPDRIDEFFKLCIAHFEPEKISVQIDGIYPYGVLDLQRLPSEAFTNALSQCRERLQNAGPPAVFAAKAFQGVSQSVFKSEASLQSAGRSSMSVPNTAARVPTSLGASEIGTIMARSDGQYNPSDIEVQAEADRVLLCEDLMNLLYLTPEESEASVDSRSLPRKNIKTILKRNPPAVSHYVLDFGYVVKGTTKTKNFKLENISSTPITFGIDRYALESVGFSMEPKYVIRLPGAYDFGVEDISITLNAKADVVHLGKLEYDLPLDVRKGPNIVIHLRALITMPELQVSRNVLDFGDVQSGHAKTITVAFYNPKEVPCNWKLSKPRNVTPEWENFILKPTQGILNPGETQMVTVTFTPEHNKDGKYEIKLPLKIVRNKKGTNLVCKAVGYTLQMAIEPPYINLGACLPSTTEDTATEQLELEADFEVVNNCDHDVEVIALDVDKQYLIDEEVMREYSRFEQDSQILLEPRYPGQKLWEEMVEEHTEKQKAKEAEENEDPAAKKEAEPEPSQEGKEEGEAVGDLEPVEPEPEPAPKLYVLVSSAECEGSQACCQDQCDLLSQRYQLPVVGIDQLLTEGLEAMKKLKEEAEKNADQEQEEDEGKKKTPDKADKGKKKTPDKADKGKKKTPDKKSKDAQDSPESEEGQYGEALELAATSYASGFILNGLQGSKMEDQKECLNLVLKALKLEREKEADNAEALKYKGSDKLFINVLKLNDNGIPPPVVEASEDGSENAEVEGEPPAEAQEEEKAEAEEPKKAEGEGGDENEEEEEAEPQFIKYEEHRSMFLSVLTGEEEGEMQDTSEYGMVSLHVRDGYLDKDALFDDIIGFRWDMGKLLTTLPQVESDSLMVAEAYTQQLVSIPVMRGIRNPVLHHKLFIQKEVEAEEGKEEEEKEVVLEPASGRWLIPARGSVKLKVKFNSDEVGSFTETLGFEIAAFGIPSNFSALVCQSTCAYPQISQDYRNVFYQKVKTHTKKGANDRILPVVNKQYVVSEQAFEFGPLICGRTLKEEDGEGDATQQNHCGKFRITNCGLFDLDVDFKFKSAMDGGKPSSIFSLKPDKLHLSRDETTDLSVYAFPGEVDKYEDSLVCVIDKNPQPVEFAISCLGAKPYVVVSEEKPEMTEGEPKEEEDTSTPTEACKVDFGRLLLGHRDDRKILVKNPTMMPISWKLSESEALANGLSLSHMEGTIEPEKVDEIIVGFNAINTGEFVQALVMEVRHIVVDGPRVTISEEVDQKVDIEITTEAYEIEVDVSFESKGEEAQKGLDYGLIRAENPCSKPVTIQNKGKYEIGYNVMSRTAKARDLFEFEPKEGKIAPGASTTFTAKFNPTASLKQEMKLHTNSYIAIEILETLTEKTEHTIPVRVDVDAVFSKYVLRPANGLNFGPHVYDTDSEPKTFEILNKGEFDFDFDIVPYRTGSDDEEESAKNAAKGGDLAVGNFNVSPTTGNVKPGESASVTVTFKAEGERTFCEILGMNIQGRDPSDSPGGIPYEIKGESCIPGIETQDVQSIFEEHLVVASVDHFAPLEFESANQTPTFNYSIADREFNFGPVVASLDAVDGDMDDMHVAVANLKITNPTKVPCSVAYSLKARQTGDASSESPITLSPSEAYIPAHEHRYVTLTFNPKSIGTFLSTFEAVVDKGIDGVTRCFTCDVRGEGTLPHIVVEGTKLSSGGAPFTLPTVLFPRILPCRVAQKSIVMKNTGMIPAKFRFEMMQEDEEDTFHLSSAGLSEGKWIEMKPKQSVGFTVEFAPKEAKNFSRNIKFEVQKNPFDSQIIALQGECYTQSLSFENLPGNTEDEIHVPDLPLSGQPYETIFSVISHAQQRVRFEFPEVYRCLAEGEADERENHGITFSPSMGHLEPGERKDIVLSLTPKAAMKLDAHEIALSVSEIKYLDSNSSTEAGSWDNSITVEEKEEPAFETISQSEGAIALKIFAVADNAKPECDAGPINFKSTMMFQSRVYSFSLKNTSTAAMPYSWEVTGGSPGSEDENPYTVTPTSGTIEEGQEHTISVRFSPKEIDESDYARMLVCAIPNLEEGFEPIQRKLTGKATRPWCHFNLPEVDIQSLQHKREDLANLNDSVRVIEFESLGIKVKNTRRFNVYNPTNVSYEFRWDQDPSQNAKDRSSSFRCLTRKGEIQPGKKFEMVFEFIPDAIKASESWWTFSIPRHDISEQFLLFGVVSEPRVMFDRQNIHFGKVLTGTRVNEVVNLVNSEHIPFAFNLDASSYKDSAEEAILQFEPSSGSVQPNSSLPVKIIYIPKKEKLSNYNVTCTVRKKPTKLNLNLKGEGYSVHSSLLLEQSGDMHAQIELASNTVNYVDFGQVLINEKAFKTLTLVNTGDVNFTYMFNVGDGPQNSYMGRGMQYVSVHPDSGTVAKGEKVNLEVAFNPHKPLFLDSLPVVCSIVNGDSYEMRLSGVGYKPRLDFSFTSHDFGPCFIYQDGMKLEQANLVIVNQDERDVSIDLDFEGLEYLDVNISTLCLSPGERQEVAITFRPQSPTYYKETLHFEINGLFTIPVLITGEGVEMKLDIGNPGKQIAFGSIRAMQSVMKAVRITNRSKLPISISPKSSIPYLLNKNVSVFPAHDIYLRGKESTIVNLTFNPVKRMRPFSQDVAFDCNGLQKTLFSVSGGCLGVEMRLSNDALQFGGVVSGSRVTKTVFLENIGDVGTNFEWDVSSLSQNFSIYPPKSYISSQQDAKLDVTFHPTQQDPEPYIEQISCRVNDGPTLALSLSGMCIAQKPEGEVLEFSSRVREEETKNISIKNSTSDAWHIKPVVHNDMWTGPENFVVEANSTADYPITYKPLLMTTEGSKHDSTIFFPLPNGSGLLYQVRGEALPPVSAGTVKINAVAKKRHVELLDVSNWLNRPQRFHCAVEVAESDDSESKMSGAEFIDVAGMATRDYKLTFYCYKEGGTKAKVTFTNPETKEFLFYDVEVTTGPPEDQGTLVLECPVRQKATDRIIISNPLDEDVTFAVSSEDKHVFFPAEVVAKAKSMAHVEVTFRPILPVESETKLSIGSTQLGSFPYLLKLKGIPAGAEGRMSFVVPLGGSETQAFRFQHYANAKTDYACSFSSKGNNGFLCDASVTAHPAGQEGNQVEVNVTFEPTQIGETFRDTLVVTSPVGGEYICPVIGRCVPPKPQGPILLSGDSGTLSFKNVMTQEAKFSFSVDNPCFTVKQEETIAAKKTITVKISYKKSEGHPSTGKLIVSCAETPSTWVYYLNSK